MTEPRPKESSVFVQLHAEIADRLADLTAFGAPAKLDVIREDKHDVLAEQEARLARLGLCLVVRTPTIVSGDAEDQITATVVVVGTENVTKNRGRGGTGVPALALATAVMSALHRPWTPEFGGWTAFRFKSLEMGDSPNEQEYVLTFETQTQLLFEE